MCRFIRQKIIKLSSTANGHKQKIKNRPPTRCVRVQRKRSSQFVSYLEPETTRPQHINKCNQKRSSKKHYPALVVSTPKKAGSPPLDGCHNLEQVAIPHEPSPPAPPSTRLHLHCNRGHRSGDRRIPPTERLTQNIVEQRPHSRFYTNSITCSQFVVLIQHRK